jgi:hypothetical protein
MINEKRHQETIKYLESLKRIKAPLRQNEPHKTVLLDKLKNELYTPAGKQRKAAPLITRFVVPLASAALIIAAVLTGVSVNRHGEESLTTIVSQTGAVMFESEEQGQLGGLKDGQAIPNQTAIRTERGSSLVLALHGRSMVTLQESSRVRINSLSLKPEIMHASVTLETGEIECEIKLPSPDSSFEVMTRTSRISVTGTRFSVKVTDDDELFVKVREGTVRVDHFIKSEDELDSHALASDEIAGKVQALIDQAAVFVSAGNDYSINMDTVEAENTGISFIIKKMVQNQTPENILTALGDLGKLMSENKNQNTQGLKKTTEDNDRTKQENGRDIPGTVDSGSNRESSGKEITEKPDKAEPIVLPINGSFETGPDGWKKAEGTDNLAWTAEAGRSPTKSLKITSSAKQEGILAWIYTYSGPIPADGNIRLKVFCKTQALHGNGAALTVRADDTSAPEGQAELYATTQGLKSITGSRDWFEYMVFLPPHARKNIKSITIYLIMLPQTTGTVYFDDVSLEAVGTDRQN